MTLQPLRIPEPADPWTTPTTPAAPAGGESWTDQAWALAEQYQAVIVIAAVSLAALIAFSLIQALIQRLRGTPAPVAGKGALFRKALVFVAASIGSGFTIFSMWRVMEHQMHVPTALRIVFCGLFEIAMLTSALNSRAFRIMLAAAKEAKEKQQEENGDADTGVEQDSAEKPAEDEQQPVDVDRIAAWTIATIGAVACAADGATPVDSGMRLIVPYLVAWLWERAIASDLHVFTRARRKKTVTYRISFERIAVWLGIAEATGRQLKDVDRDRRIARLARTVFRYELIREMPSGKVRDVRLWLAGRRMQRQIEAADEHLGITINPALRAQFQTRLAALYQAVDGNSADALKHLRPWSAGTVNVIDGTFVETPTPVTVTLDQSSPVNPAPHETVTTSPTADVTLSSVTEASRHPSPEPAVTADGDAPAEHPVTPSPRAAVTPSTSPRRAVTNARSGDGDGRVVKVAPLSRDLIDAQFRSWSQEQIETYAAERAQQVLAETSNKTEGLREYFLTCLALGVKPVGARMAKAVGASEGLARGNTSKWYGELAVADAEQVLMEAHARVLAEVSGDGDGDE